MNKYYFTFGQSHTHRVNGFTWDCDVICCINASSEGIARDLMFESFGDKWAMSYSKCPDLSFFPRGVKELN